jgi:polysaccharide deacetylase 2 family uncharacterized protein YibQ
MKKTVKDSSKSTSQRKNSKKRPVRTYKKRSMKKSNTLRAFQLVVVLVALSAGISFAVIKIHSVMEKPPPTAIADDGLSIPAIEESEPEHQDKQPEIIDSGVVSAPAPAPEQPPARISPPASNAAPSTAPAAQPTAQPAVIPARNLGNLVFVIDDAGNNLRELEPFLRIPAPLTIAVLPGLPYSAEAARRIRAAGKEVILHQPMEALGSQYPGPGAIYSGMSADEIRAILKRNIAEVGPVAGINNHQGSKITMDREIMETILAFCSEHDLYFLDSRTTAETAAPAVARQLGMKIAERDVFIDNEQDRDSMLGFITNGLVRAQRNGSAVMIGHTWSPELAPLLAEQFPAFLNQGYTIKAASDIIKTER